MAAALFGHLEIILSTVVYINLCLFHHHIAAQPLFYNCTNPISNYTQNNNTTNNNTILLANLKSILSTVASGVNTYGFYNGTAGQGVDQVNAIAICRGDLDTASCQSCVSGAAQELIMTLCPYTHKEGFIWVEECMFRYSTNKSILGIMSLTPSYLFINHKKASNVQELRLFSDYLVNQPAFNGSFRKFAAMNSSVDVVTKVETIYGFMQCTPDITPGDCLFCLNYGNSLLKEFSRVGARFLSPSCYFRYATYNFLNEISNQPPLPSPSLSSPAQPPPLPSPSLSSPAPLPPNSGKSKTVIVVGIILGLLVPILSLCVFIVRRRRHKENTEQQPQEEEVVVLDAIGGSETRQYDFALIRAATEDFSTANMLGRGGFGVVYKGAISNGKEIAVKRLSATSGQGEKEFRNEVMLLAKLQHNCLVKLLGFCLEQTERLLVYEFMANGSLDRILFGDLVNRSRLDWERRYKIIKSVAKGILYLHEDSRLMIIHRDLKASNILLDEDMNAKISDFGMAKLFVWDESEAHTRRIAGTFGYMAPEYAMHGLFSVKSDVYSYGVLILEIVSGKRNYYSQTEHRVEDLLSYAYKIWNEGKASDLIDPMLMAGSYSLGSMIRCIHIALLCVQENVGNRPTMATVVLMLQSLTLTLPLPSEPGFFSNTASHSPWLSGFQEATRPPRSAHVAAHNDPPLNEDTDSYLYPR